MIRTEMFRMVRVIALCLFLQMLALSVTGQDYRQRYAEAKALFADKRFDKSMDAFRGLMVYDQRNPFAEYALFYYALSGYHQNLRQLARTSLLKLDSLYPKFPQRDEVRYWLALIYFEEGEPFQAMKWIGAMKQPESAKSLKESHLAGIRDPEILRMLLEDSHDAVVARMLINRLLAQKRPETIAESRKLMASYGFAEGEFVIPEPVGFSAESPRISLLFPFLAKGLEPTPGTKRNQYVLDLYNGMRLAVDSMNRAGQSVDLRAYDTERNPDKLRQLTTLEELASSDVLVGPLFSDELPMVREFSMRHDVPMIHPVSSNPDYLAGNPHGFLFQPSFATIGKRSAEFAKSLALPGPCYIFYENTPRDSVMAFAFRQRAQEIGLRIGVFKRVTKETSAQIGGIMTTPVRYDKFRNPVEFKVPKDSIGAVFVASDNELIFTKVISSVDARNDQTVVIGQESWLEKSVVDLVKFEDLGVVLAAPNHHDPWSSAYRIFQRDYLRTFGQPPSAYARIGYEFGMFLIRECASSQDGLEASLARSGPRSGTVGGGQEYGGPRDNQAVPMVRFVNGVLNRLR